MLPIKDTIQSRSFPLVNWLLIGLNVVMFFGELTAAATGNAQSLIYNFGVVPERFLSYHDARELSTLITSMFLHGGWFHLLSNTWALYIFGDNVEDRMGPGRYLVFYLLCGLAADATHIYFNRYSTMPSIGASGAIAGVLGAYLLLFPRARIIALVPIFFFPLFFEIPAVFYLVFWFFAQFLNGMLQIVQNVYRPDAQTTGGVAFWAHFGGFLAGVLLVWPFTAPQPKPRKRYVDEYYPW